MPPLFFAKLKARSIEKETVRGYTVFRVKEELALGADFGALTAMIERCVKKGKTKIALHFTANSYLYTPTLARLVEYYRMLADHGGTLCLIQPNAEIMQVLEMIGLGRLIRVVPSEDAI